MIDYRVVCDTGFGPEATLLSADEFSLTDFGWTVFYTESRMVAAFQNALIVTEVGSDAE